MSFPSYKKALPRLSSEQMIEVDRAMIEDYHIELIQMMENAGRNLAFLAKERFLALEANNIVVLAGAGGNGGGALVSARHLSNWGAKITVLTTKEAESFTAVPAHQLDILSRMGIAINPKYVEAELIIDGLIGYSLAGSPRGMAAQLITWANAQEAAILSLDIPSGLSSAANKVFEPAIKATATMTLALPKEVLFLRAAKPYVGELYLADISVPGSLYAKPALNLQVGNIFAKGPILSLG